MPKTIVIADSTQISSFCECPQMWILRHQELLLPSGVSESSEAAMQGVYGHHLLEHFYKGVAKGLARDKALEAAFVEPLPARNGESFNLDPVLMFKVKERVRMYVMAHMVQNTDFQLTEPKQVEVGFSVEIDSTSDHLYVLEGRLDLVNVSLSGLNCIADHKFQLRRHDLYKKSIQFRNYAMVSDAKMLIINYIRLAKSIDQDTFRRDVALFTHEEHKWWRGQLIKIFRNMQTALENGPEKNWGACAGRFNESCFYTPLCCEQNDDLRENMKSQLYKIVPEWKPW